MYSRTTLTDIAKTEKHEHIAQNIFKLLDIKSLSRVIVTGHDMENAVQQYYYREHEENLHAAFPESKRADISSIKVLPGGLTNASISFAMSDAKQYVSRKVGAGSSLFINRLCEKKNVALACELGVAPQVIYHADSGNQVVAFIPGAKSMNATRIREEGNLEKCVQLMKTMHTSEKHFENSVDVFEFCRNVHRILNKVLDPLTAKRLDDFREIEKRLEGLEALLKKLNLPTAPCHFDPNPGNFVDSYGTMFLIDFEYSCELPPQWDLSDCSMENTFDSIWDNKMLCIYYGESVPEKDRHVVTVFKPVVEYVWALWAMMQIGLQSQLDKREGLEQHSRRLDVSKQLLDSREYRLAFAALEERVKEPAPVCRF